MSTASYRKSLEENIQKFCGVPYPIILGHLDVLLRKVRDEERESCLQIVDDMEPTDSTDLRHSGAKEACLRIKKAIRIRGEKKS